MRINQIKIPLRIYVIERTAVSTIKSRGYGSFAIQEILLNHVDTADITPGISIIAGISVSILRLRHIQIHKYKMTEASCHAEQVKHFMGAEPLMF